MVWQSHFIYQQPPLGALFVPYFSRSPVNGSIYSFMLIWSFAISSCNWFWIYSRIAPSYFPTVSTLHQKCLFPYFYFKFACLSNIIKLLLLFIYPTYCATLIWGGIATNMCIWSGQHSPSITSTPLRSLKSLNIFPMSALIFPYITCLLYFGAKTIWYLQRHLLCDRLWTSSFLTKTSCVFFMVARPFSD